MQWNPGDETGCVDEINDICQSDNNSFPLTTKARRFNAALDRFFTIAFKADGRWTFDDVNHGTDPIETQNLVQDQQTYSLDDFTSEILNVLRFEITSSNGLNQILTRLERESVPGALTQYQPNSSIPQEYDLVGRTIYLYPKPNYSSTNGLKVYFNRNASKFTSADTTKEPGVPSIFHQYLCNMASLPYLIEFQKPQKNDVQALVVRDEGEIVKYFANREVRLGGGLRNRPVNSR